MEYFKFGSYNIELNRKMKNKNIYFRVKSTGNITVNCPYHTKNETIMVYLEQFIKKIETKYDTSALTKLDYQDGGSFRFLGEQYEILYLKSTKNNCLISDDKLLVYLKESNYENALKVIDKFMKEQALRIFTPRFAELASNFEQIDFLPTLKIKKMTSKFGVCFYKKASITLSTLLLHYDYECLDYVIIHELAHFVQPNHSKKFYYLIEIYLPNYKKAEAKLKNLRLTY